MPAEQQTCSPAVRVEHSFGSELYFVNSAGVIPHSDASEEPTRSKSVNRVCFKHFDYLHVSPDLTCSVEQVARGASARATCVAASDPKIDVPFVKVPFVKGR